MGLIKGVLREELENSIRLKKRYEEELKSHPGGSLILKKIRGHSYYYLAFREGKRVRFIYKGKQLRKEFLEEFRKSKQLRLKYKQMIKQLSSRIKYLRKALRGKENV
ncbi:MAG: hypothetical protein PHP46_03870 [Candidatus Omnitrophica bacterium]|nr:hypothetical protein [Candidatus Omnitrophota bacterium]